MGNHLDVTAESRQTGSEDPLSKRLCGLGFLLVQGFLWTRQSSVSCCSPMASSQLFENIVLQTGNPRGPKKVGASESIQVLCCLLLHKVKVRAWADDHTPILHICKVRAQDPCCYSGTKPPQRGPASYRWPANSFRATSAPCARGKQGGYISETDIPVMVGGLTSTDWWLMNRSKPSTSRIVVETLALWSSLVPVRSPVRSPVGRAGIYRIANPDKRVRTIF